MVPMMLTNCGNLLEPTGKFKGRDLVTFCRGKLRRGPIKGVIEDGRTVLIQYLWVAEMGPDGQWSAAPNTVAVDVLKNDLAMWQADRLCLFTKGYTYAAIMPEGDNLGPDLVRRV